MCHKDQSRSLGNGLAESVVEDETVHASLSRRNIVGADSDLISLAVADPFDAAQANVEQLVHDSAGLVLGNRAPSLSPIIHGFIVAVGARRGFEGSRRRGGHSRSEAIFCSRVFEDGKVDAFLVRLHAPSNRVAFSDVDPAHDVALLFCCSSALQLVYTFGPVRAPLSSMHQLTLEWICRFSILAPFPCRVYSDSRNIQSCKNRRVPLGM